MPYNPNITYRASFEKDLPTIDILQFQPSSSIHTDNVVPSFITQGFGHAVTPLPRLTYDLLEGWNLIAIALVLLLIVLNKQLYPRQFRQVLSVPRGVSHTNQLLREWSPVRSFLGWTFLFSYILMMALFVQKSCIILSRDVAQYNTTRVFCILAGMVGGWIVLRYIALYFVNWLFGTKDAIDRQMTVQLSVISFGLIALLPIVLILFYNPYSLFVWIGCGIVAASAFTRFVIEIMETRISTKIPLFYIFLYFCALEIAPVATLVTAGWRYFNHGSVF